MYVLCKLVTNELNNSLLHHPMNVIMRSVDIGDLSKEIIKRVHDGSPIQSFRIYEEVDFQMTSTLIFEGVSYEP